MKKLISLKILTSEKVVYEDEVSSVTLLTEAGEIGILPNHSPLVSIIKTGEIKVKKESQKETISLSIFSGILEVRNSSTEDKEKTEVIILASESELATKLNLEKAKESYERATEAMEDKSKLSDVDFAKFQGIIDKELNRIKIGKKYKK